MKAQGVLSKEQVIREGRFGAFTNGMRQEGQTFEEITRWTIETFICRKGTRYRCGRGNVPMEGRSPWKLILKQKTP